MMPVKILITDKVHDVLINSLTEKKCEVTYDTSVNNQALER